MKVKQNHCQWFCFYNNMRYEDAWEPINALYLHLSSPYDSYVDWMSSKILYYIFCI